MERIVTLCLLWASAAVSTGVVGFSASPQIATDTGLISGQIVDATSGVPILGATVVLNVLPAPRTDQSPDSNRQRFVPQERTPRLLTGASGRFVFRSLPAGAFQISVLAPSYIDGRAGQSRPEGPSRPVELRDGERVDLKIRMWKYAVISGTVVDEAGEPAVGVQVRVMRRTMRAGRSQFSSALGSKTDDRGTFRVAGLKPGDFIVAIPQTLTTAPATVFDSLRQEFTTGTSANFNGSSAAAMPETIATRIGDLKIGATSGLRPPQLQNGRILAYQTLFYPSGTSAAEALTITLVSGEERTGVDFRLRLVPTVIVTGRVIGSEPSRGGGVTVRLVAPGTTDQINDANFDIARAVSLDNGAFTFVGVPPGQYTAMALRNPRPAIPDDIASNPMLSMIISRDPARREGASATVPVFVQTSLTVGSADVDGISLTLTKGASLSGQLEFEGNTPRPSAQQLRTMQVLLDPVDSRGLVAMMDVTGRVEPDGRFQTGGYPVGRYIISLASGGIGPAWVPKSAMVAGRQSLTEAFDLNEADITNVVITLTDRVGQLTGRVTGSTSGAAVEDVSIILFPTDYRSWIATGRPPHQLRQTMATKTGTYLISSVLAGDYLVAAVADADLTPDQGAASVEALARLATRISVAEAEHKTLDLKTVRVTR